MAGAVSGGLGVSLFVAGATCREILGDSWTQVPFDASSIQPQGDPFGPLLMSLWAQAGVNSVSRAVPTNHSSTKVYLDDRTVTASSPQDLFRLCCWLVVGCGCWLVGWLR